MKWNAMLVIVGAGLGCVLGSHPSWAQETWGPSIRIGEHALYARPNTCPAGKYAIGLQVNSGIYVHGMQLECARLGSSGEHQSVELVGIIIGWLGGTTRQLRCRDGEALYGFRGREGWWIDRIEIACRAWRGGIGTDGTTYWRGSAGGTGGESYGPIKCPAHMAVYQVEGRYDEHYLYNTLVYGYTFKCKSA